MKGAAWRETSMVMLAQAVTASRKGAEATGATESKGSKRPQEKEAHVSRQRREMSMATIDVSLRRSTKAAQPWPADASADPSEVVIQCHESDNDGAGNSSTPAADVEFPATPLTSAAMLER